MGKIYKYVLCLLLLTFSWTLLSAQTFHASYLYRKKITLNSNSLISGNNNLVNFPILIDVTDNDLRRVASGGKVQSSKAAVLAATGDIAFIAASAAVQTSANELSYQVESYNDVTGNLKVWVKIPSLTKATNYVLNLYFGATSPSTHPTAISTWTADYKGIYHFNESASPVNTGTDGVGATASIVNGVGAGNSSTTPYATPYKMTASNVVAGKIGNAYSFNGAQKIVTTNNIDITSSFTISAWVKANAVNLDQKIVNNHNSSYKGYKLGLYWDGRAEVESNGSGYFTNRSASGGTALNNTDWYYVQGVFNGSTVATYINGVLDRTATGAVATAGGLVYMGAAGESGGTSGFFNGIIDEVRISNVAKSADWLRTEYNNQNNPRVGGFINSFAATETNASPSVPADANASANTIAENAINGSTVEITARSTDPEGNVITYTLTNTAGGRFTINSSTGAVTVANGTLLNYESATSHSITVQATDGLLTSSQTFSITVTNVVETYTWTGNLSTDIKNSGNWDNTTSGAVNQMAGIATVENGVIPTGLSRYPSLTSDFIANDLLIANGARLNLSGYNFNIGGNLTNNGQILYNNSNSSKITFNGSSANQTYSGNAAAAQVGALVINNSASGTITINGGGLDVYSLATVTQGTLNSNGNLTLKASASSLASIGPLPNGSAVTGDVNVEVYFTGGTVAHRSTRVISSPINENLSTLKTYQQLKQTIPITGPGGTGNGFDAGGTSQPFAVTLTKYNEPSTLTQSQFKSVANINEALAPGNAAFLFFRGNRTNLAAKLNAPFSLPENVTMKFTGPINQGNVMVNLSYTNNSGDSRNGYNLIGNPYPSIINWESVTKTTNVVNELKFIKPAGGYATYLNGITTNAEGLDLRYIQPGQGFYTRVSAPGESVTFTESAKSVSSTPVRLLSVQNNNLLTFNGEPTSESGSTGSNPTPKQLRISLQDNLNIEETATVFQSGRSASATIEDALFFGGSTVSLSTLSSDEVKLAINFMPDLNEVSVLKLNVGSTASGNLKMNFTDLSAIEDHSVVLQDNYLFTLTDVKANPSYDFAVNTSDTATFGSSRFKLLFKPTTSVPVQITSLSVNKITSGAQLNWVAESIKTLDHFDIERSSDATSFHTIGSVKVNGNFDEKKHSFIDKKPLNAENYYRLKLIDNRGNHTFSKTVSLNYLLKSFSFSIYPNPATDLIMIGGIENTNGVGLKIFDFNGRIIKSRTIVKGYTISENVADLASGVFVIQLSDIVTNKILGVAKLIKK